MMTTAKPSLPGLFFYKGVGWGSHRLQLCRVFSSDDGLRAVKFGLSEGSSVCMRFMKGEWSSEPIHEQTEGAVWCRAESQRVKEGK